LNVNPNCGPACGPAGTHDDQAVFEVGDAGAFKWRELRPKAAGYAVAGKEMLVQVAGLSFTQAKLGNGLSERHALVHRANGVKQMESVVHQRTLRPGAAADLRRSSSAS
jgi:hypothetical protein